MSSRRYISRGNLFFEDGFMNTFTPYQDPTYFIILAIALIPIVIGILYGKKVRIYELMILIFFLYLSFGGKNIQQGIALIVYLTF